MTDFTVLSPGQVNGAGDTLATFLKMASGEVLTAFKNKTLFDKMHRTRSVKGQKSAAFQRTGRLGARYVTPGVTQTGQTMNGNELIVNIDGELLADAFVASIDEAMAHWDVRAPITEAMGDALAQAYDKNVALNIVRAARSANVVTGLPGGSVVSSLNMNSDATVLAAAIYTAAQTMDEKFLGDDNRSLALRPMQYNLAVQKTDLINKDWDGRGSYAEGKIQSVAGITILKSNNTPGTDRSLDTSIPTRYRINAAKTVGVIWRPDAVATLKLMDIKTEADYQIRERGHYMVASYAMGHDPLRVEEAVELAIP